MLLILVPLALVSGYRAWVQVFSLEFQPVPSLTEGAVVSAAVTTSGRATLRAVVRGRPQFLRLPPPEIRTIDVLVAPGSGADGGRPAVQVP
jgi:hypothetical protein